MRYEVGQEIEYCLFDEWLRGRIVRGIVSFGRTWWCVGDLSGFDRTCNEFLDYNVRPVSPLKRLAEAAE